MQHSRDDPDLPTPDAEGFLPADTPPAWGTEAFDQRLQRLLRKSRNLPDRAGVYLMKDAKGVVVYVGKAARLCDRVSSYFVPSADLGHRKQPMLDVVHDFDTLLCEGEWEALLTENRLIKDIKPRFNVRLTDDKTFPYLVITQREDFPRVFVTRNPTGLEEGGTIAPEMKGARVFGPFANAGALREAVQLLQRVFKFRTCKLDIVDGDEKNRFFRPCLLHAINQCTAPCAAKITREAYAADVDHFVRFLGTKRTTIINEMRREMEAAAGELKFERAAALRDQIRAIEKLDERASRADGWQPEAEISYVDPAKSLKSLQKTLGLDEPIRCIEGIDIAHLQGGETVGSKVCFIDGRPFKSEYRRFRIKTGGSGAGRRAVIIDDTDEPRPASAEDAGAGQDVGSLDPFSAEFSAHAIPAIMPTIGGRASAPTGPINDDYNSIREVVSRRYREAGSGSELYPDVILIDGGLGQLHAALEAFEQLSIRPPMVISLAKKEELVYVQRRSEPIRLSRDNLGLKLLQAVRDEAHRFAQHYHHILRRKKTLGE
ncbi:MAG TPA: excinuclease ABC subunit UvrC [Phycisphaerales bacterium]|nr:excinuclease ABC subunit UvrC [Phycisphaerales bacterium]